ncbi:hypothetical protein GCM10012286_27660 [Streptomyces lasiicapitis]|uniref:Uncharacterized protein n=1 Tax=Streptomyces lasiicapitis TaxID=1923961 RepID=A0ABQ2LW55_9ACTN|nr:hypothetical protein GCM10012286_27660 [Streptomyces lasiicapitis]
MGGGRGRLGGFSGFSGLGGFSGFSRGFGGGRGCGRSRSFGRGSRHSLNYGAGVGAGGLRDGLGVTGSNLVLDDRLQDRYSLRPGLRSAHRTRPAQWPYGGHSAPGRRLPWPVPGFGP